MSKMTWDNPVFIGPAMAARMGLKSEDLIRFGTEWKKGHGSNLDSGWPSR